MKQHSEILPQLAAFHDGQLTVQERQEMQAHLDTCASCHRKLADWQALDSALLSLTVPEVSTARLHEQALSAIESEPVPASRQPIKAGPSRLRIWALAAVVVMAAVSTFVWQNGRHPTPEPARTDATSNQPAPAQPKVESAPVQERSPGLASETSKPEAEKLKLSAASSAPTAPGPVGTGVSGIPQASDWPARFSGPEVTILASLHLEKKMRFVKYTAPEEVIELNLVPLFEAAFVPVGYKPLEPKLNPGHEAAYSDPVLLTPENAYLVSNLRLEQTSLMARSHEEGPTADVALRLAEITWRLANITADRDDVQSAVAAINLAVQHRPEMAASAQSRLTALRALGGQ